MAKKKQGKTYEVVVGNVGSVQMTNNKREALKTYRAYVRISKGALGRAGGEDVHLILDETDMIAEFHYIDFIIGMQAEKVQRIEKQLVEQQAIFNQLCKTQREEE